MESIYNNTNKSQYYQFEPAASLSLGGATRALKEDLFVIGGLVLGLIPKRQRVRLNDGVFEKEELSARAKTVRAALTRLKEFKGRSDDAILQHLRSGYENRMRDLESRTDTPRVRAT